MLKFLIAPDFPPTHFSGWHMLNTLLQQRLSCAIRLAMPADRKEEMQWKSSNRADLVYANPFDAVDLIRDLGYLPVVRPNGVSNEVVIATYRDAPYRHSDELPENCRILITANKDVRTIGLRLLESASLKEEQVCWSNASTFQAAARRLIRQEADAAFFLASAYQAFGRRTRSQMRVLMHSHLDDICHMLLLHPDYAELREPLTALLMGMSQAQTDPAGVRVLADLGMPAGFSRLESEDAEFMLDLIETLRG